nr:1-deoxy-D-xylulose-5-phosphate synthase [Candidatus Riesia pediculicola]
MITYLEKMKTNSIFYPILSKINNPKDLRSLSEKKLSKLCLEIRRFLLHSVSKSSGHLASGLGVIELTVALHYVYNTPFDHLIWDTGHQSYPHKILTGRRDKMHTIRKKDGLHPFPWREESEYDILSVGHSSTSISVGLGLSIAAKKEGKNRKTICVIGDGAMTSGIAFEAINHVGFIKEDLLIILNDNKMSISNNTGALHETLLGETKYYQSKKFNQVLEKKEKFVSNSLKRRSRNFFRSLGLNYFGPIEGNDVYHLIRTIEYLKKRRGPKLLHIITKKGNGYLPAEKDPILWHCVPQFNLKNANKSIKRNKKKMFSDLFGKWLCREASTDPKLIAITPAMKEGSGMKNFCKFYPNQFFDVAISEQHAVTFAAGLAIGGYHPIVSIYSTFLQRAYDQIIHDVAIQNLPILFAVDRSGIVGEDGPTHQGSFDLTYLRCIPKIVIMSPSNEEELINMLHTGFHYRKGPVVVRYPKCYQKKFLKIQSFSKMKIGEALIKRSGKKIAILNFGTLIEEAKIVSNRLDATLVDMRFVKPLDEKMILKLVQNHRVLITLEENSTFGGAGSGVNECVLKNKIFIPILNIGFPDNFIKQGNRREIYEEIGLNSKGIENTIQNYCNKII